MLPMRQSYELSDIDAWTIVVAWGRRDSDFQHWRSVSMESDDQAYQVATKIIEKKLRKGYRVVE